ncbi:hypothetical protein BJ912DRAFT_850262 [Pholiota molesta]|nr:hypothetical protein BJ912DRAFT_850262 [Pholiota molesta]
MGTLELNTLELNTKVAYSTTATSRDLDNCLQRKKLGERLLSEEDGEWVDCTDNKQEARRQSAFADAPSAVCIERVVRFQTSPRKGGASKAAKVGNTSRKLAYIPTSIPSLEPLIDAQANSGETSDLVFSALSEVVKFGGQYVFSILKTISHLTRWPPVFCIACFLSMAMTGYLSKALGRAFEPLCIIPGISSTLLCNSNPSSSLLTNSGGNLAPKWADYLKVMDVQTQSFELFLGDIVAGSALSLEIKMAEIIATDLITCIHDIDLKAKDDLAVSLYKISIQVGKAERGLQKLATEVGGALDNMMAVNNYALRSIASARANKPSSWSSRIGDVVTRAMNVFSANMEQLIVEVEQNLRHLNNLEERLATLHVVVAHEEWSISTAKSDLLEDFWTKLGGNRKSLKSYECRLFLLKRWDRYRKQALVHVAAALQALQATSEDMEDMRERMVVVDLTGTIIPVEVYVKSIQTGLKRLREGMN